MSYALSQRSRRILSALVDEYISSGEPVASRTLAKHHRLSLSPATIRNELADLEELGFVSQPHTSAGRVPTERGFRFFVDTLVEPEELSPEDRLAVKRCFRELAPTDDVVRGAGRLLASLTSAASVVTAPRPEEEPLAQIRFLPLREGQLLAVLVTRNGTVQNRIVPVSAAFDGSDLEQVHNYLEPLVRGRSLGALRDAVAADVEGARSILESARALLDATLGGAPTRGTMVIEGQGLLFHRKEFADAEKIRAYLEAFEQRQRLLDLLESTLAAGGVRVVIGAEAHLEPVQDISLVAVRYGRPGQASGVISVLGPQRMDYAKVVPLVRYTARAMTDLLGVAEPEPADS